MATQRRRKHARIEVTGDVRLEERIPRWEMDLVVAALTRLVSNCPAVSAELDDARK